MIKTKSVYDDPERGDGYRLLIMRRWPRGVRKDRVDAWEKDLAPSEELLRAWRREEITYADFRYRYLQEIRDKKELLRRLIEQAECGTVTLLCWEADETQCHRGILKEYLERWMRK